MLSLSCVQICNYLDVDCPDKDVVFTSISTDTRTIQPGDLFIAIEGGKFNGHEFVQAAIQAGAAGVLVSEPVQASVPVITVKNTIWAYGQIAALYRSKFKIPVLAITGSCGKTSVTNMLANILAQMGPILHPPGSYNNEIGLPKTLLQLNSTHKYAVLEMGARHVGDIKYLMELVNPNVTMVNNVAPVHIETFGNLDDIARGKGEIYEYLQPHGTAVINVDDAYAPYWLSKLHTQNIITFGLEYTADVTCAYYLEEHHRIRLELVTNIGSIEVMLPVIGRHNVYNAIAAAAMARAVDVPLEAIKLGLESFKPVTRRMEIKRGKNGATIIDDSYNANPQAMQYAIEVLAKHPGKRILVVADMLELGDESVARHAEVGRIARGAGIDCMLACGDLARYTIDEFGERGRFFVDKRGLIDELGAMLDAGTVVLVKGSNGMRMDEVVGALVEGNK